jgi:predicted ATP-dependent serine protease
MFIIWNFPKQCNKCNTWNYIKEVIPKKSTRFKQCHAVDKLQLEQEIEFKIEIETKNWNQGLNWKKNWN